MVFPNSDGVVERRLLCDVPAVGGSDHRQAVSPGVEFVHQDLHVDPVASIHGEHQDLTPVAGGSEQEERQADTERGENSPGQIGSHGVWNEQRTVKITFKGCRCRTDKG